MNFIEFCISRLSSADTFSLLKFHCVSTLISPIPPLLQSTLFLSPSVAVLSMKFAYFHTQLPPLKLVTSLLKRQRCSVPQSPPSTFSARSFICSPVSPGPFRSVAGPQEKHNPTERGVSNRSNLQGTSP